MFLLALFAIAKTWKQIKCPLADEWIKKMWHIHRMEYYSVMKNKIILLAATWMDLEIIILSEVSRGKKTNVISYDLCAEFKNMIQMNLFTKQK